MPAADGAKIVTFATSKLLSKVGTGECFDLANLALKDQGAKSADAYGTITPDADYVWGDAIAVSGATAGDILQYRDFVITTKMNGGTKITFSPTDEITYAIVDDSETGGTVFTRPHHTAIVVLGSGPNEVKVLEQNVERSDPTKKEQTVGYMTHLHTAPADTTVTKKAMVTINAAWAAARKAEYNDAVYSKSIDELVAKHGGKAFEAVTTLTTSITITGTIKAYRAQMP